MKVVVLLLALLTASAAQNPPYVIRVDVPLVTDYFHGGIGLTVAEAVSPALIRTAVPWSS